MPRWTGLAYHRCGGLSTNNRSRVKRYERLRRRLSALLSSLAFSLLVLIALACGGGSPAPSPNQTPVAGASPPPPDVPLDIELADTLRHDGDFEQAIVIYDAIARFSDADDQLRALESLARLHYQQGRLDEAETALTSLLGVDTPSQGWEQALLLLGSVQQGLGRIDGARDSLESYIEGGGVASSHARLKLAAVLSSMGDDGGAIEELEAALAEDLPPPQETVALFALARAQEAVEREADALASWQRLAEDAATPFDRGEALWLLSALAGRSGEPERAQEAVVTLARDYPWHPRSLESLGLPGYAPAPVLSTADRGMVLFNHGLNEQATEAFRTSLDEDASAVGQARGHYRLALLAERAGQPDAALDEYDAALAALDDEESVDLYGEAAWERALLLEALGRREEAVAAYAGLVEAAPDSQRAPEAAFRAGFLRFVDGRPADAVFHWTHYLEVAAGTDVARARFWLGKAAIAVGDTASADGYLSQAAAAGPWDYFGMRARAILDGEARLPLAEPVPDVVEPNWNAIEIWLASWSGPEDVEATRRMTDGLPWRRGLELQMSGLKDEAQDQYAALINDVAGEPWLLYRLARALDDQGHTEMAARAAARLAGERLDAPPDVLRLAYANDYLDLATIQAEDGGFSPLLLLALVRQESFFRPEAESSAGALGLTQVIPTTADEIAEQLGEADFTYADLLRPNVSLRFGAHYLSSQLSLFEGDVAAALAAYNGGPGNSLRWQSIAPTDPDVFLESIDLTETRAYVELVLEHYARYRFAYGLAEGPTLPLP